MYIYKTEYNSFSRKVKNQHDPDSEEISQDAVTPDHNIHHSGTTDNTYMDMQQLQSLK
jgi:hypothetical protein